jgi:hypothetical protein
MKNGLFRVLLLIVADLIVTRWAVGQSSQPIPRIEWKGGEKIAIANQFATGGVDPIRCDKDGNIYSVADAQTGEGLWVYEPAKDLYGIPTCYRG